MTKFDPTKPVQTRDGREAEICWTDGGGDYPIGGWFRLTSGSKAPAVWPSDGSLSSSNFEDSLDLINIPEEPITIERWVRVEEDDIIVDGFCTPVYTAKKGARNTARKGTVAIARVTITFTPGEGLDDD